MKYIKRHGRYHKDDDFDQILYMYEQNILSSSIQIADLSENDDKTQWVFTLQICRNLIFRRWNDDVKEFYVVPDVVHQAQCTLPKDDGIDIVPIGSNMYQEFRDHCDRIQIPEPVGVGGNRRWQASSEHHCYEGWTVTLPKQFYVLRDGKFVMVQNKYLEEDYTC